MTRYLKPILHLQQLPKGRSKPQLIRFNDGNEYVAGKLAQLLSLPVVPFRVVYIAKKFIMENPELSAHNFQWGYQLASLYITDSSKVADQSIHQIVRSIPRDWDVSDQEKEALVEYLIQSNKSLPNLSLPPEETLSQ